MKLIKSSIFSYYKKQLAIREQMSIKDFTILAKLGEGAYSSVYKVERLIDHKQYALKKVKLGNLSQKQLQNAINEVRILASVSNKHIVSYKEAFVEGKNLCLVMEFADGGDLYQKIMQYKKKNKNFEQNQIWNVLIQVTRGLKSLHDLKIFHRDLKSANVFLSKDGSVKLGDMNVSKLAKNGLLYTQTGTPYYASPQVWKDKPYDSKSDIWSFGAVIYEMATLEPPFKAEDMEGLFQAVTNGIYPSIPAYYSKQLANVIKLMLQQNPVNRPSCDKLLKSALLLKKSKQLEISVQGEIHNELLKTIRIPKKLHYLTSCLPKSKYEPIRSSMNMFQNAKGEDKFGGQSLDRQSTLPKLDRVLRYHQDQIKRKQPRGNYEKRISPNGQENRVKNIHLSYGLKPNLQSHREEVKDYLRRLKREETHQLSYKIQGLPLLKR